MIPAFFLGSLFIFAVYQTRAPSMSVEYLLIFNGIFALMVLSSDFILTKLQKRKNGFSN